MTDKKYLSLLLLIPALVIALMLPLQNSIYSDDVAFSQSVRHFVQTGDLKVSEYTAASSLSHIVWGAMFVKLLGFSFATLNISVIVLLPFLLIGFYLLLRELNNSPIKSFIFSLFFLAIPWITFLTFTFMSDISFLTLEIYGLLSFVKFLNTKQGKYLAISLILSTIAFLMRQLGLALIFGVFAALVCDGKFSMNYYKKYLPALLVPIIALFLYQFWLSQPGNKTIPQFALETQTADTLKNFLPFTNVTPEERLLNITLMIHRTFNYVNQAMGLLFPLIFVIFLSNIRSIKNFLFKNYLLILCSTAVVTLLYLLDIVSFRNQYLVGFPLLIYEYESLLPIPWAHIWKYLVLFSIPVWATLIWLSIIHFKKITVEQIYLLTSFLAILFMTVITFYSWDRYLLPLLPFVFLFLASITRTWKLHVGLSLVVVAILLLDAVQITKLRYDEVGTLYRVGGNLVSQGIEPSTIDLNRDQGWDIWYYYEEGIQQQIKEAGGDKRKIYFQRFPLPKKVIKYGVYTDRMIKYQKLNFDENREVIIPFRSLFVSSKLIFINY